MEQGIHFERTTPIREPVFFTRRDWLALLGAAACGAGYAFLHPSVFSTGSLCLPGIGLTLSCWLMLAVSLGYIGWGKLKWSRQSAFLLLSTLLLSAAYGIFSNQALRYMNLPVLAGLFIMAVFSLKHGANALTSSLLTDAAGHALRSLCRHIPTPAFALLDLLKHGRNRRVKELLLGLAICIPVLGFIILLLCDADAMFSGLFSTLFSQIHSPNIGLALWNLLRMLLSTLLLFAFIYGLNRTLDEKEAAKPRRCLPKLTICTVLAAMSAIYAAFVYIQCRYLFAGNEAALMEGGYAAYARSGFFQLVIVAFITMLVVLPSLCMLPEIRSVRMLCASTTLMTMVIVFSAFWRMRLYILEYGLTFLRAVTLWGILAVSAAMIATLIKALRPKTRIFGALFVFAICTWIAFNYVNADARIAQYNLNAFRSGAMESIDVDYLRLLGPEGYAALTTLQQENALPVEQMGCVIQYRAEILNSVPAPYDWSLNWLKVTK